MRRWVLWVSYGVTVEETRMQDGMGRLGSDHLNVCICAIGSWRYSGGGVRGEEMSCVLTQWRRCVSVRPHCFFCTCRRRAPCKCSRGSLWISLYLRPCLSTPHHVSCSAPPSPSSSPSSPLPLTRPSTILVTWRRSGSTTDIPALLRGRK